jgi:hypothetical protein
MSEKQKSYAKWLVALLALFGAGTGADAAGFEMMDLEQLEKLGIIGGIIVALYMHVYIRPLLVTGITGIKGTNERLDRLEVRELARDLPEKKRTATGPQLVVTNPVGS